MLLLITISFLNHPPRPMAKHRAGENSLFPFHLLCHFLVFPCRCTFCQSIPSWRSSKQTKHVALSYYVMAFASKNIWVRASEAYSATVSSVKLLFNIFIRLFENIEHYEILILILFCFHICHRKMLSPHLSRLCL